MLTKVDNKQLTRPSDFIKVAEEAKARVDPGHGSRVVVRYQGKTIGFPNHGNREYPRSYRFLLIKAFRAAGLLALIAGLLIGVFHV